jgi:hypothetical protein
MARRRFALLSLLAACFSVMLTPAATGAARKHVPGFDLLVRPTSVSNLPPSLRLGFERTHKHGLRVRVGQVRLPEGVLTAAGNYRWICTGYRAKGEPKFLAAGGCSSRGQAAREGLIDICGKRGESLRIAGLVPNGVATVEFDLGGAKKFTVPVDRNAFTAPLPRANLVFRALDTDGETEIEHRYPLADAHGDACFSFFEARAEE